MVTICCSRRTAFCVFGKDEFESFVPEENRDKGQSPDCGMGVGFIAVDAAQGRQHSNPGVNGDKGFFAGLLNKL